MQFGEAVRSDIPVGFHFKLPIIQEVKKYDARIQTLDEEPDRILTVESKYLLVDSFIKYKISDVLTFYKANNGSFNSLNSLLGQRSEFVLKNNFGKRTVKEVVSGERDELMNIMLNQLNDSVADLGVEIIDFRVKRIDLPSNLSNSVYERMRTERNRLAEELRSEGKEIAREIRAVADNYERAGAVVIDYLETREEVDSKKIGIYGVSMGSYWSLRLASYDNRPAALASGVATFNPNNTIFFSFFSKVQTNVYVYWRAWMMKKNLIKWLKNDC